MRSNGRCRHHKQREVALETRLLKTLEQVGAAERETGLNVNKIQ